MKSLHQMAILAEMMAGATAPPFSPEYSSPEFHPRKHTVMSYAKQNRIAKQKRKQRG